MVLLLLWISLSSLYHELPRLNTLGKIFILITVLDDLLYPQILNVEVMDIPSLLRKFKRKLNAGLIQLFVVDGQCCRKEGGQSTSEEIYFRT